MTTQNNILGYPSTTVPLVNTPYYVGGYTASTCVCNARKDKLEELHRLISSYNSLNRSDTIGSMNPGISSIAHRLEGIIQQLTDELYPRVNEEEALEKMEKPVLPTLTKGSVLNTNMQTGPRNMVLDNVPDEDVETASEQDPIDVAAEGERTYYTYKAMMDILVTGNDIRAARDMWDNALNSEYIKFTFGKGVSKYFNSNNSHNYHKSVEHTYYPTDQDEAAEDWYFL
jgi:hypothetical protein